MKSDSISPLYLRKADDLIKRGHSHLQERDEVYFLGEYTVHERSEYSRVNQLIMNYKKPMNRRGLSEWSYKEEAIRQVADLFRVLILREKYLSERIHDATLVPIPPSMTKSRAEYDDRNFKMLQLLRPKGDIRELILQKETRDPLHKLKNTLRNPQDLMKNYYLNHDVLKPAPKEIWLFDDVLTKGTHYRAAQTFLQLEFPDIPIVGFFIARAISKPE